MAWKYPTNRTVAVSPLYTMVEPKMPSLSPLSWLGYMSDRTTNMAIFQGSLEPPEMTPLSALQVFFSAYIFNSNVMVKVATQPADNPLDVLSRKLHLGPGMGRDVPRLSLPGKLVFPRYHSLTVGSGSMFKPPTAFTTAVLMSSETQACISSHSVLLCPLLLSPYYPLCNLPFTVFWLSVFFLPISHPSLPPVPQAVTSPCWGLGTS